MSVMAGIELDSDVERLEHLDFDIESACEVPARAAAIGGGTPKCPGGPARWVAWRDICCPASPRYLLMCDECKRTYQAWMALAGFVTCGDCGAEGTYHTYTKLNRKS
jgi:hypothetical protein